MSVRGLLPVDPGIGKGRWGVVKIEEGAVVVAVEWESMEGIPYVEREGVEDVGLLVEDVGDERHLGYVCYCEMGNGKQGREAV